MDLKPEAFGPCIVHHALSDGRERRFVFKQSLRRTSSSRKQMQGTGHPPMTGAMATYILPNLPGM